MSCVRLKGLVCVGLMAGAEKMVKINEDLISDFRSAQSIDDKLLVMFQQQMHSQTSTSVRFDAVDTHMDTFESRLSSLEAAKNKPATGLWRFPKGCKLH